MKQSHVLLLISFLFVAQAHAFRFFANSDLHVSEESLTQETEKMRQREQMQARITQLSATDPVRAVILAGDLTDNGTVTELRLFQTMWIEQLTKFHIPVYLAHGNHDCGTRHTVGDVSFFDKPPVIKYIEETYGSTHYSFDIEDVRFICCGVFPKEANYLKCWCPFTMSWLQRELRDAGPLHPVVIFFHYNLVGDFSDWWTDGARDEFFNTIEDYNVKMIITGHKHETFTHLWRGRFPTVCVGGRHFAEFAYDAATDRMNTQFYDAYGQVASWEAFEKPAYVEK